MPVSELFSVPLWFESWTALLRTDALDDVQREV
jgi:hypothetical protein